MKKKMLLLAALAVMVFALSCSASAAEAEPVEAGAADILQGIEEAEGYQGTVDVMYVPEWDCYVITTEVGTPADEYVSTALDPARDASEKRADPEKEASKSFTHSVVDAAGTTIARFTATVTGTYSQADGTAQITRIGCDVTYDLFGGLTYRTEYNGSRGTLFVRYAGNKEIGFTYRIYTNGTIQRE